MTHGHLMFQLENVAYWVPGEGHAAALVDDVMYVFGGRCGWQGSRPYSLFRFDTVRVPEYGTGSEWKVWARNGCCSQSSIASAVSPMNNTSISQRAISPQQQRSMSPTTNAGQRAVSPTTTAESERASSPSSRNVIKPPKGAVTALGAGGVAMTASAGSPPLGWSTREGGSGPPRREDYSSFTIDRSDKDSTLSTITNTTVTEKSRAMCANTSRLRGAMIVETLRSNGWLLEIHRRL
ncbi:hypothetical protein FRC02_003346 [Tulasnella sp. 418]|nr:hypothetical protein FRC02_003346 [Tulasnella sp. 418]